MYNFALPKHFIRKLIIFTTSVWLLIVIIMGLIAHISLTDLVIAALITIGEGIIIVGLIGWVAVRFIYPYLYSDDKKPAIASKMPENVAKEIKVEYELNAEDVAAYIIYNYEHSTQLKLSRKFLRIILLFVLGVEILGVMLLVVILKEYSFSIALGVLAVMTLIWYFCYPSIIQRSLKRGIPGIYGQSQNMLTGKHILLINPDLLVDKTDMGESTTRWSAVEYLTPTNQYLFVSVRGSGPHIIPKRAFADEALFKQFAETAIAYHHAATLA